MKMRTMRVKLPSQPLLEAIIDVLINGILQLKMLPSRCPLNLHYRKVYITPFHEGYLLPTFGDIEALN